MRPGGEGAPLAAVGGTAAVPLPRRAGISPRAIAALRRWSGPLGLAPVTLLAAGLRLWALGRTPLDPFYDAAVRSMSDSWHNFFFGAFDPGATTSVDKPPLDLWLQVASVKLLGFTTAPLLLPEALAGTLAVPLLGDAVRRVFGTPAGIVAALALAVLPVSVLTSRSDTMDSLLMLLLVAALWLAIRWGQRDSLAAAAGVGLVMGLAFNVKLLEALIPLPALALLVWTVSAAPRRRRLAALAVAGTLFVVVALAWATAVSLAPRSQRPYPIGSTNGSVWNVIFVFNGTDRLGAPRHAAAPAVRSHPRTASHRAHHRRNHRFSRGRVFPATPAGPLRLFTPSGSHYGGALGSELVPALLFAGVAAAVGGAAWRRRREDRVAWAVALSFGVWLALGVVGFSLMARLHPRYLEVISPAVATFLGVGVMRLVGARGRGALAGGALAVAGTLAYGAYLSDGSLAWAIAALAGAALIAGAWVSARRPARQPLAVGAAAILAIVVVLAVPLAVSVSLVRQHRSDSGRVGALPDAEVAGVGRFLDAHRIPGGYDFAAVGTIPASPLIARDNRRVMILSTYRGRPLATLAQLRAAIRAGKLRYAYLGSECGRAHPAANADCPATAGWVKRHSRDISRRVGLRAAGSLREIRRVGV